MKKNSFRFCLLCLCLIAAVLCFAGCQDEPVDDPGVPVSIIKDGTSDFVIVYPSGSTSELKTATAISNELRSLSGYRFKPVADSNEPAEHEILVGRTNRALSTTLANAVLTGSEDHRWGIASDGNNMAIIVSDDVALEQLFADLADHYFSGENLTVMSNLFSVKTYTLAEEAADKAAAEAAAAEAARQAQLKKAQTIIQQIKALSFDDFGGTTITTDLGGTWDEPPVNPIAQHPRLLFTADDLPTLRAAFTDEENFPTLVKAYRELVETPCTGILGEKVDYTNNPNYAPGVYNYDPEILIVIQSKALEYAMTGNVYYGYESILAMCNYMKTLDIGYFQDDQWRRYGHTMYVAACVYDWCYDLLDSATFGYDIKLLITSGVEHLLCSGTSSMPEYAHYNGIKMEMGFPPLKSDGYIVGHSSETQFMRDYLSYAVAIYDEVPGWWEMIGGRLYEEYVPPRIDIYNSGMFPEGTSGYAQMRYMSDLRGAWILTKAVGENPYKDTGMKNIVLSFLGHEANGYVFQTGDETAVSNFTIRTFAGDAIMSYYLYPDSTVLSMLRTTLGEDIDYVIYNHTQLNPIEVLMCVAGSLGEETNPDWRKNLPTIQYNDGYYQQIIIRNGWEGKNTVAVLMKGAGYSSGGHDHEDFGTFQIYYKGILCGEGGVYDTYGTNQHLYYHEATVAHNGLLIFNTKRISSTYYSGGERKLNSTIDKNWLSMSQYCFGEVTGVAYDYFDEEKAHPAYAYYANDLTKAYTADQVTYVGRNMLVTYTQDTNVPMVMFIYDRIDAIDAAFPKTFLLQCVNTPTVSGNVVSMTNAGGGKLVLTSLKGGDNITYYGGDQQFYLPDVKKTLLPNNNEKSEMIGRIEIRPNTGNKSDLLMNVIYVTDSGKTVSVTPTLVETSNYIGAVAMNQMAIFGNGLTYTDRELTVASRTDVSTYYVGGIIADEWKVTDDNGNVVATVAVDETSHFLTFTYTGDATNLHIVPASFCEHSVGTTYESDGENHWKVCTKCQRNVEVTAHTLVEGAVITQPSGCKSGTKAVTCSVCSYQSTVPVYAKNAVHTYDVGKLSDDGTKMTYTCSVCQEESVKTVVKNVDMSEKNSIALYNSSYGVFTDGSYTFRNETEDGSTYWVWTHEGADLSSTVQAQYREIKTTDTAGTIEFVMKGLDKDNTSVTLSFQFMNTSAASGAGRFCAFMGLFGNTLKTSNGSVITELSKTSFKRIVMDYEITGGQLKMVFYVNGVKTAATSVSCSLQDGAPTCLYLNGSLRKANTGYAFDSIILTKD